MTDQYAIIWAIADRVAQREYQNALALGYSRLEAMRRHMVVYGETMEMLS